MLYKPNLHIKPYRNAIDIDAMEEENDEGARADITAWRIAGLFPWDKEAPKKLNKLAVGDARATAEAKNTADKVQSAIIKTKQIGLIDC